MAIRKIVSRSILDGTVQTVDLAAGSLSSAGLDITGAGGTGAALLPKGTTAQRPSSPEEGYIRYNTTLHNYEQYTNLGWVSIAAPPTINSVATSTILGSADPQTITINGANFDAGASVTILGANLSTTYTPATTTYVSGSQITCTFTSAGGLLTGVGSTSGGGEPYSVKVTNSTGLSTTLSSAFSINDIVTWSTSAGNLATIYNGTAMSTVTVAATDPESVGITYAVSSGSLPPSISLNTSTGAITGTSNTNTGYVANGGVGTTYNFTLTASDGANTAVSRSFNIIKKWYDGSTSTLAPAAATSIYDLGVTTNGYYWLNLDGTARQFYCDMTNGGWIMVAHWSPNTDNSGTAAVGSTSYAASVGGYTGATNAAVSQPGSANDLYNNYGALNSTYGGQTGSWVWNSNTRGTNTGGSWFRNSTDPSGGKVACYRPNNYGYSWSQCKYGLRLSAPNGSGAYNSQDGFPSQARNINQAYVDGISVTSGSSTSRTHQWTYAYDGTATGGNFGEGYGGNVATFIAGNYTTMYTTTSGSAYQDVTKSFTLGSASTTPPEFRNISDQDSDNEDTYIRGFYIFLK